METAMDMGWAAVGYLICFLLGTGLGVWIGYKIWKRKVLERMNLNY